MRTKTHTLNPMPSNDINRSFDFSQNYYAYNSNLNQEVDLRQAYDDLLFDRGAGNLIFLLPMEIEVSHSEFVYDIEENTLSVFSVDDTAERVANAPHNPSLLAGSLSVDANDAVLAEGLRNRIWVAYMKGLGAGRFNTETHHTAARAVADAVVNLFYLTAFEMVETLGITEAQVTRILDSQGRVARFESQRSAAVFTIATRDPEDAICSPERAVELVRQNADTGRATS